MLWKSWLLVCLFILGNLSVLFFTVATVKHKKMPPMQKTDPKYHVAYPQKYRFIHDQPKKCEEHKPFIVVIVPVAPENTEARDGIRRTWGGEELVQKKVLLVLFLLGSRSANQTLQNQLKNESQQNRDLLQSDFHDSYRNLTIKTMVMMEWLGRNCLQASYGVKVDADVLLNTKNLLYMLVSLKTLRTNYVTGLVVYKSSVLRNPASKFFIPYDVYSKSRYPPYPLGMCYIFSMDLPEKILQASAHVKPIFIEDVYLGMCLNRLGILPQKPPNMGQFVINPWPYDRCHFSGLIAVHTHSTRQLVSYWTDVQFTLTPCRGAFTSV